MEEHSDVNKVGDNRDLRNGTKNDILILRFIGAVNIGGQTYRVKTTMREYKDTNRENTPYTYEVTNVEVLEEKSPSTSNGVPKSLNGRMAVAKLLQGVEKSYEKGKNLLAESKKGFSNQRNRISEQSVSQEPT